MNWEAIGAIGEILGAAAVFVTLVYLAMQIRQNTASMTTSVYESAMGGFNELNQTLISNLELASIHRRALYDPDSLNDDELFVFNFILRVYLNHVYKLFRLYQRGVFPEEEWRITASEANDVIFSRELGRNFMENNHYYDELKLELEKHEAHGFTSFGFSERGDA